MRVICLPHHRLNRLHQFPLSRHHLHHHLRRSLLSLHRFLHHLGQGPRRLQQDQDLLQARRFLLPLQYHRSLLQRQQLLFSFFAFVFTAG